jgi:hypothetical protein
MSDFRKHSESRHRGHRHSRMSETEIASGLGKYAPSDIRTLRTQTDDGDLNVASNIGITQRKPRPPTQPLHLPKAPVRTPGGAAADKCILAFVTDRDQKGRKRP